MGDIVAAEPIVRHLRKDNPDAFLVWCIGKPYRAMADSHPDVDMTLPVRCLTEWIMLRNIAGFDRIVDLHVPGRTCGDCVIPLKKDTGNLLITATNYYNFGNLLNVMSQNADLSMESISPRMYLSDEISGRVDQYALPKSFIVVHCASNEDSRNWEAGKWSALVKRLVDEFGIDVVEVGLRPEIARFNLPHYVDLCARLTIPETAEVIRRAHVFIGVDSGPAHIANAVGTFGIILIGKYRNFSHYMPYSGAYESGQNAQIIYHDGAARDIQLQTVIDAVWAKLHMSMEEHVRGGSGRLGFRDSKA